ncbi:MAG: GTPase HflX [Acholeplasmatales bacterium]|nr:GTPase HflX [Acholeplasmatales bacterium]
MRALLVGVTTKNDRYDIEYSLDELKNLAETLDIEVIDRIYQKLDAPNSKTYIGSGKLSEIVIAVNAYDIDLIIFNDELTPAQLRNCEEYLKVEVIDRSYLILKIFELRAKTKESKLEIKLAKDLYLLPRIQFLREKESRIGGGASTSTRGAGETQKELDRRHLLAEINHIKNELSQIKKMKTSQIEKRKKNEIPIVALVGYTNAGKSSTMNSILKYTNINENKNVEAKDQLFATLSTYNRMINYNKVNFMLVDTIGFVSKLPHNLVNSFYETLQEIKNADLIIHVVDTSSKYLNEQLNVVLEVLYSLEASHIPSIFLLNKWDNTIDETISTPGYKSIQFSNKTMLNIDLLLNSILEEISPSTIRARLLIPYNKGDLAHMIEKKAHIYSKEYQSYGTYFDAEIPVNIYGILSEYDLDTMVS